MLLFSVLAFFGHKARGILAPQPGIEPAPPALQDEGLKRWTTREVLTLGSLSTPLHGIFAQNCTEPVINETEG